MTLKRKEIKVFAPATVANLACGFDVLGMSIEHPGDVVVIRESEIDGLRLVKISGDSGRLPLNIEENTATVAISSLLLELGKKVNWEVEIHKQMPLGSGMGSSAASAAAGVWAAAQMLGLDYLPKDLLKHAMEGERKACGSAHADNVAPALIGGVVLVRSYEPLEVLELPVPDDLHYVLVHPEVEVPTAIARAIMPKQIPVSSAIAQWGNLAAFVSALYQNDYELMRRSVVDFIAEPIRADFIPEFTKVKSEAYRCGALACSISGSGPSVFALVKGPEKLASIADSMQKVFTQNQVQSQAYFGKVSKEGARVIE